MRQAAHAIRAAKRTALCVRTQPPALPVGRSAARGITLLELLVVMVILLMVTAAAIPIMAPALQNRQMREATRLVTAYFGAAKARAVQSGRPVGVVIQRFEDSAHAFQMAQVEVPPPYSGDIVNAQLTVADSTSPSAGAKYHLRQRFGTQIDNGLKDVKWFGGAEVTAGQFNNRMVKVGDQIQFNGQGPLLLVLGPDTNSDGVIDAISTATPLDIAYVFDLPARPYFFPWSNTGATLPKPQPPTYTIFRQPVRTSTPPLTLPDGLVFDLSISCMGSTLFNRRDYSGNVNTVPSAPLVPFDPTIVFSPSGRVEWVNDVTTGQLVRPTDPVYLLLGRRDLMFDVTSRTQPQDLVFQNLSPIPPNPANPRVTPAPNYWVVIGPQTGQVNTAQVAPHVQDYTNAGGYTLGSPPSSPSTQADLITLALFGTTNSPSITGALSFAREAQSLGGR